MTASRLCCPPGYNWVANNKLVLLQKVPVWEPNQITPSGPLSLFGGKIFTTLFKISFGNHCFKVSISHSPLPLTYSQTLLWRWFWGIWPNVLSASLKLSTHLSNQKDIWFPSPIIFPLSFRTSCHIPARLFRRLESLFLLEVSNGHSVFLLYLPLKNLIYSSSKSTSIF